MRETSAASSGATLGGATGSRIFGQSPILPSPPSRRRVMMGFLDKLLGRSKAVTDEVADKGKELAGDVEDKAERGTGPKQDGLEGGEPEQGGEGSQEDDINGQSTSAT
jgi:hypothetical protein